MRWCGVSVLGVVLIGSLAGQEPGPWEAGVVAQVYPAGVIVGVAGAYRLTERDSLVVHVSGNRSDRRDWGEHDDETGAGGGVGVSWRHWFRPGRTGFFAGARADVWSLAIDWEDDNPDRSGDTDLIVVQPTAQAGWSVPLDQDRQFRLDLTASLGAEINVATDGEDVGEGLILLGGVELWYAW